MSIGTAIFAVGLMAFVFALFVLGLVARQWRQMNSEREQALREFEETRASIKQGARRASERFKL